jgi:hypothetical protein
MGYLTNNEVYYEGLLTIFGIDLKNLKAKDLAEETYTKDLPHIRVIISLDEQKRITFIRIYPKEK